MTPKNILSGFHTTGVYPPNRSAITLPVEKVHNLASDTGIAYIPLYTPIKRRISIRATVEDSPLIVSNLSDSQFGNLHLADSHLSDSHLSDPLLSDSPLPTSYQPAVRQSSLGQFLTCPAVPPRRTLPKSKSSLRVLTSSENLKRIEEKEKEKQRKAQEKEERAKKDKQRTAEGKDSCWSEVSSKTEG